MLAKSAILPAAPTAARGTRSMAPYRTSIVFSDTMNKNIAIITQHLRSKGEKENLGSVLTHSITWWHERRHDTDHDRLHQHYKTYRTDVALDPKRGSRNIYFQDETMDLVAEIGNYLSGVNFDGEPIRGLKSSKAISYRPDWYWNLRLIVALALALRADSLTQ